MNVELAALQEAKYKAMIETLSVLVHEVVNEQKEQQKQLDFLEKVLMQDLSKITKIERNLQEKFKVLEGAVMEHVHMPDAHVSPIEIPVGLEKK